MYSVFLGLRSLLFLLAPLGTSSFGWFPIEVCIKTINVCVFSVILAPGALNWVDSSQKRHCRQWGAWCERTWGTLAGLDVWVEHAGTLWNSFIYGVCNALRSLRAWVVLQLDIWGFPWKFDITSNRKVSPSTDSGEFTYTCVSSYMIRYKEFLSSFIPYALFLQA